MGTSCGQGARGIIRRPPRSQRPADRSAARRCRRHCVAPSRLPTVLRRAGWMTAGVGKIFHVDEESEACAPPALERPDRTCECGLATASCESCASRDTSRRLADTILYANNSAPLLRAVCYEAEADASSRVCARGPHGGEQHAYCACRLRSGASWPDEHVATLAIRRLKRFEQMGAPAKPFLLVVGFLRPHVPAHAPLRSLAAADALAISHALPDASARGPSTLQRAQPSTLDGMERRMSRGRVGAAASIARPRRCASSKWTARAPLVRKRPGLLLHVLRQRREMFLSRLRCWLGRQRKAVHLLTV